MKNTFKYLELVPGMGCRGGLVEILKIPSESMCAGAPLGNLERGGAAIFVIGRMR